MIGSLRLALVDFVHGETLGALRLLGFVLLILGESLGLASALVVGGGSLILECLESLLPHASLLESIGILGDLLSD